MYLKMRPGVTIPPAARTVMTKPQIHLSAGRVNSTTRPQTLTVVTLQITGIKVELIPTRDLTLVKISQGRARCRASRPVKAFLLESFTGQRVSSRQADRQPLSGPNTGLRPGPQSLWWEQRRLSDTTSFKWAGNDRIGLANSHAVKKGVKDWSARGNSATRHDTKSGRIIGSRRSDLISTKAATHHAVHPERRGTGSDR